MNAHLVGFASSKDHLAIENVGEGEDVYVFVFVWNVFKVDEGELFAE